MGLEGCIGVFRGGGKAGRAYQAAGKIHVKAEKGNLIGPGDGDTQGR